MQIKEHIAKSQERQYFTLAFDLPRGIHQLQIQYQYPRTGSEEAVIDLGLMDQAGKFLGWSGSARDEIYVSRDDATPGYYRSEMQPGKWNVILGAYKVPRQGLDVELIITFTPIEAKWYVGDFHMHSTASDGEHDLDILIRKAKAKHLDFIAVSNHNNSAENNKLPEVSGLSLIPAVEWTHYKGHLNIFGIREPFTEQFIVNSEDEMLSLLNDAKAKGALLSVNHPRDEYCPWDWEDNAIYDVIEVWNSLMRPSNLEAISFWHAELMKGRRLPIVGGSDYHRDRHFARMARPVTWVYAESRNYEDLLAALAKGRSYISNKPDGIRLDLSCGEYRMGDVVSVLEVPMINYAVRNISIVHQIYLVTNTREIRLDKREGSIVVEEDWSFAYLKVVIPIKGMKLVRAISNPIYFSE